MVSVAADLARVMERITRPGDFCVTGVREVLAPGLEVLGVGPIALPLLPFQAEQLIAAARRAPFGRGEQTLIDTDVRRTWQIHARQVRIQSRAWAGTLAGIVAQVAEGLGVPEPIEAELYKLLIYDEGDFFVSHRDTEKTPGMFATLVVALPSICEGGELVVRHQGREVRFDPRGSEPSEAAFAAFYADCLHEVAPVRSGRRLTLVYNLIRRTADAAPEPPNHEGERDRLTTILRQWRDDDIPADEESPAKVIYLLEHAYTQESLSFGTLKGADAGRAVTLVTAARASDCDVHLALLAIEESGSAEHTGAYRSRRWGRHEDDDEDQFQVSEVFERIETLSDWRRPDGRDAGLGILPFGEEEISPPGALDDLAPDDQSFSEATGNEGASFERTYRRAALVAWPGRRRLAVINQGGLAATLPYLADLTTRWIDHGEIAESPAWAEAHELSGHMIASWPREGWHAGSPSDAGVMLDLLHRLGDTLRIDGFLTHVSAAGAYGKADNEAILSAMRRLARPRIGALLGAILAQNAGTRPAGCWDLLSRAATAAGSGALDVRPVDLVEAAGALADALPGDPARTRPVELWMRPPRIEPDVIVDAITALDRIDSGLAAKAADTFLAWPKTYGLDDMLIPAVLGFGGAATSESSARARLRGACIAHLRARIAEPLSAPSDWARAGKVGCACARCDELSRFLVDPARATWNFKAAQPDRSHVESTIRDSRCDVDFKTLRQGSPHILACAKNQASFERRVRQRRKDLEKLARIEIAFTTVAP